MDGAADMQSNASVCLLKELRFCSREKEPCSRTAIAVVFKALAYRRFLHQPVRHILLLV